MKLNQGKNYDSVIENMNKALLFKNLSEDDLMEILKDESTRINVYSKGEVLFGENDKPQRLFILLSGSVGIVKNTGSGKRIILHQIEKPGEIFGEIYLFMQKENYEIQAEAVAKSEVLELKNNIFLQSHEGKMSIIDEKLRNNMLRIFAGKAYQMNQKVKILGCSSIREKIVTFLLERQKKGQTVILVPGREEMADYMNVARPSLSRELLSMQNEGIIYLEKGKIKVRNQELLESFL